MSQLANSEYIISDLRHQPRFKATVAHRIWQAWWIGQDVPLSYIEGRVEEDLTSNRIPFALVAHRSKVFLGTASVIAHDMDERPQYSPWVALVWVDPEHRGSGVGSALVRAAGDAAFKLGHSPVYLCATPEKSSFYRRLGWEAIEDGVSGMNVFMCSQ
ncbi:GNAT family N-acetyltransferase [Aminobacter sp. BA135]|uniref:GNAT family N-acetyltransferase n=1 Tax=Aminobacter sp. BA135 TaxID=537596 RepID=UPI003D7BD4F3